MKSINIPEGITSFSWNSFEGCSLDVVLLGGPNLLELEEFPSAKRFVATWANGSRRVASSGQVVERISAAEAQRLFPAVARQKPAGPQSASLVQNVTVPSSSQQFPVAVPIAASAPNSLRPIQVSGQSPIAVQKAVAPVPSAQHSAAGVRKASGAAVQQQSASAAQRVSASVLQSAMPKDTVVLAWDEFEQIASMQKGGHSLEVLRMRHKPTGRVVVAKIISTKIVGAQRVYREVELLRKFSGCPQIIPFAGVSHPPAGPDAIAVITVFAEGGNFDAALKAKNLSSAQLSQILTDVLMGLSALHKSGVIHRDIKPNNILLNRLKDHAFLCDLGASRLDEQDATQTVMFTEGYVAEEARAGRAGPASDIFSFGVLLREAVTGTKATESPWLAVREGKFDVRGVGNPLVASLILDCVQRDPAARPKIDVVLERFKSIDPASLLLKKDGSGTRTIRFREGDDPTVCGLTAKETDTLGDALEGLGLEGRLYLNGLAVPLKARIGKLDPDVVYVFR